jgi:hypothetical protein
MVLAQVDAVRGWLSGILDVLVVVLAIWRGRWRERVVAFTWLFPDNFIPGAIRWYVCSHFCMAGAHPFSPWLSLIADLVMLGVCAWVIFRANRYWTIWACAFALLSIVTDVVAIVISGLAMQFAYWWADQVWWLLLGAAVAWGCIGDRTAVAARSARIQPSLAA